MIIDAMGLILADHDHVLLSDLTQPRALAAVPFAGRYRIIDFILSNMVNSGIKFVGVLTESKYRSLMDHMGTGSSWDLDRMTQRLFILPPFLNTSRRRGDPTSNLTGLLDYVENGNQSNVIIADSNVVMNESYREIYEAHVESGADITVLYNHDGDRFGSPVITLDFDDNGRMNDLLLNAPDMAKTKNFLGLSIIARDLFLNILEMMIARGQDDFSQLTLLRMFDELNIMGFEHQGRSLRINSITTYYSASMKLLERETLTDLFREDRLIFTKVKNEAPAEFLEGCKVNNVLSSDGCRFRGTAENSIFFRGVQVGKHTSVKNSIIFQDVVIQDGVILDHVIIDKDCVVRSGVELKGQADYPIVIEKGAIV